MPIGTAKLSIAMACHISTTYQLATTVGTGNFVKTALHANLPAIQLQNTGNSHHLALPFHWVKPKKTLITDQCTQVQIPSSWEKACNKQTTIGTAFHTRKGHTMHKRAPTNHRPAILHAEADSIGKTDTQAHDVTSTGSIKRRPLLRQVHAYFMLFRAPSQRSSIRLGTLQYTTSRSQTGA